MHRHPENPAAPRGPWDATRAARAPANRGFALLVTIVLVAFLVLLLVGLATFTRVETQVAANAQQQAQARQNALMALNIAVGQLQKYVGPDQRTTAPADLENPSASNPRWIGAYGSSVAADYSANPVTIAQDLTTSGNITSTGSPARLLNWLVSGNEPAPFDPRRGTGDVGSSGQIVNTSAAAGIVFKPTGAVANLAANTTAASANLTIANATGTARPARLLVGGNTVTSSLNGTLPLDYVVAPAVDIDAPASSVPGAGSTGNVTIGRYAWWVGDEGMKARVNLPLAGSDTSLTASARLEEQRNAFSNTTRAAIELMGRDNSAWGSSAPDTTSIGSLYSTGQELKKIIALQQAPMISTNSTAFAAALKYRYHDLTLRSLSLLTDTYAGGFKRDLSILLDSSYTPAGGDSTANANRLWTLHPGDTGGYVVGGGFGVPTWKHLRSFAQTRVPISGLNQYALTARVPAADKGGSDDVGVGPVLTYYSMGFRVVPAATPADGVQIHMAFYPLVVLWNPYNFTLKAPAPQADGSTYEAGIYPTYNVNLRLEKKIAGTPSTVGSFDFQKQTAGTVNDTEFIRFRLKCPDIPPGQSLIFSLPASASGQLYTQKNVLENIEPEPSAYVSAPFRNASGVAVTIQPGEAALDYQLTKNVDGAGNNISSSFWNGGGGLMYCYVGAPDDISRMPTGGATSAASRLNLNPSNPARNWYNTHQGIGWDNNVATNPIQGPGALTYDTVASEPSYVFLTQALFSGKGNNAQLDANQFMFSTRWIAQGNLRANRSGRTRRDENYNVLFTASTGTPSSKVLWQKFILNSGTNSNRASAGQGHDWINNSPVDASLFEFPYDGQPLQSIGQLQHANLSLVGSYPSYPVGNSLQDFRLHGSTGSKFASVPSGWQLARVDTGSGATLSEMGTDHNGYYDISYLLNRTLWDRYYFSTVPATGSIPATLPNPRHVVYDSSLDLRDPDRSAAALMLAGGFNINSTSEQAWRAILGGSNQLTFDPQNPDSSSTKVLPATFPRFTRPGGDDDATDAWKGYRTLSENQVAQLAHNIVAEIRARGPFVSLADFVNRRLVDNSSTTKEDESYRGTIQAAIDNISSSSDRGSYPANDGSNSFWSGDSLITSSGSVNQTSQYTDGYYSRPLVEGGLDGTTAAARTHGNRSAFAPKYITQADVLAKIGAELSPRSDTFTVRTYGEVVNPVTGDIEGRAWCEATVQRVADYVDRSVDPWLSPAAGSTDQSFGRKFKIVSFRWLSPSDI